MSNLRDISKQNHIPQTESSYEAINAGSLQRIADATEVMAKDNRSLIKDRDMYKRWYEDERDESLQLFRSNAALRGVVTKLKKKGLK